MITINSVSGGKTSAYIAANYTADYNLFSLVRTDDKRCQYPDPYIRKEVEDRIQKPFIGTLEDDKIIKTMLDLELYLGEKITWVSGITFDEVVEKKRGWLPNKLHRYCTTHLKLEPMFYWWAENIGEVVEMRIGFRANETSRKEGMRAKLNEDGNLTMKATFEKNKRGQNKWEIIEWQKPVFPLIDIKPIWKDQINEYWKDKPVQFAERNNCVGCFHKNPLLLRKQFDYFPEKMNWFLEQELSEKKGQWRSDVSYSKIEQHQLQMEIEFDDDDCDSGYCSN